MKQTETGSAAETADRARSIERGIWHPFRSLLTAQALAAVLGLVFWVFVARLVPAREVGVAAAAISAQTLLGMVTALGLGTMLIAELPLHEPGRQRRMLLRALMTVMVASFVVGGIVVAVHPLLSESLDAALDNPIGATTFVFGVAAAAWSLVVDDSALGLRRSSVQVGRNLLASTLRFPVTVLLLESGFTDAHVLQLCWVLPLLVSLPVALGRLHLPRGDRISPPLLVDLRAYVGPALRNHALSLSLAAGTQLVPVVAGLTLVPVDNAEFAIAWLMATFVFLPPYLLATALFAHGANVSTEEFRRSMERTIPAALLLSLTLCVGAWVLGGPVLLIFGGRYASDSYVIVALLVPAGLWMVFKDHLVVLWRSQHRFALATRLATIALLLELAGATIGAVIGDAVGLCVGWLAAMALEVVLATPWLRQAFGGLHWTLPHPRLRRTQAGRVAPQAVIAVAMVLGVCSIGVWSATHNGDGSTDQPGANGGLSPSSSPDACSRSASHPGPLIDLGVQASRGDEVPRMLTPAQVRHLVNLAKRAGASIISTSASFRTMQPVENGPYRFANLDLVVNAAHAAGLQVKLRLTGMPDWALDDPESPRQAPRSVAELQRWATFVKTVLQHVDGKVGYVEAWTEPDSQKFWPTGPNPVEFARLLDVTDTTVHAIDPDVKVVSGGLRGNDIGYLTALYKAFDATKLKSTPFDILGVEPFDSGAAPDVNDPSRRYDQQPYGPVDGNFLGFEALHSVMAKHGDAKLPIYITLFGYSTAKSRGVPAVTDAKRATYLTTALDETSCDSYVAAFSWYAFHPNPWDPKTWTLVDAGDRPNLTYAALRAWSQQAPK